MPVQTESTDESNRPPDELSAARARFVAATHGYSRGDSDLVREVRRLVANYYDPANRRATLIQQAARELDHEIDDFVGTFEALAGHYAMAVTIADGIALDAVIKLVADFAEAHDVDFSQPTVALGAIVQNLTEAEQRSALRWAWLALGGKWLTLAMNVAAGLLERRRYELLRYCAEAPAGGPVAISDALAETLANESAWVLCEHLLVEIGASIAPAIPFARFVVAGARVLIDLRNKVRSMQTVYVRGEVDRMFDLLQEIRDEREAMQIVFQLFDQVTELKNVQLP